MTKKNHKRKRKKRPLNANPKRQAHAQLKGYRYQIWHSVDAWLDLADDDILYLEGAEDFDILSDNTVTATQIKHTQRNITLKSQEVYDAINNFCELQTNNSDRRVKYRFLTTSKIAKEQGNPFGTDKPGIELWSRCSGDEETIAKISRFLLAQEQISDEVKKFLKKESPQRIYTKLIQLITWETDSKPIGFVEQSVSDKLVLHGNRQPIQIPPSDAQKVVDSLLKEALTVATEKENRFLTKVHFLRIFEEKTTQKVPTHYLQRLQSHATLIPDVGTKMNSSSSDHAIQPWSVLKPGIPKTYFAVHVPRTDLLRTIKTKLQSEGMSVIHGGVGKGKTTLAKSAANTISGKWYWLNFTNIDPLSTDFSIQVSQQLKQLAISIHDESSQVNVVLDDLSLQSKHLHRYKEELGVVVYNVLNRGARLLITSQHKPPDNLIRDLGVPSSISINIPNFTLSEIEHFLKEMGCPSKDTETWISLIHAHTGGHPRLVHAWLIRLHQEDWNDQELLDSILHRPKKVLDEQEAARQLLTELPEDHRKFLYRLSLIPTGFRKDYALSIGEIPEAITDPGDVFSQLVGPWIDQYDETYYTISPLLTNAAKEVWSDDKIKDLHAHIAYAMAKTKKLNTLESWAVFTHSMIGQYKEGMIAFIYSLMCASEGDWENICQEFSGLIHFKPDFPGRLFPGDIIVNNSFRLLQYRIAVKVEPEFAPNILEIWDSETKSYEPHESYLQSRLMLATQALKYNQVQLSAKKLMRYLKEIYDIKNTDREVWKSYLNSMEQLKEINIDESNFFSFLFSCVYMRTEINTTFLSDLFDTLDELQPEIRSVLLADFEEYNIDCRILIESIILLEEKQENPDWTKCLKVYDKVIEKSLVWGYPHIAALSARGKAIIHDEFLDDPITSHKVIYDITLKVVVLPEIQEEEAVIYFRHGHYQEALAIYESILPEWHIASERFGISPLEGYRTAAICAANLGEWKKAAILLEDGANKTKEIEKSERYICLYVDAGFAYFKAGRIVDCIRLLHRSLHDFETLPQNNSDLKYFTLKKRLEHTIKWIWKIWCVGEVNNSDFFEPYAGFCSDPSINEDILTLQDCPIGYTWFYLSQIEYRFGHDNNSFTTSITKPQIEKNIQF